MREVLKSWRPLPTRFLCLRITPREEDTSALRVINEFPKIFRTFSKISIFHPKLTFFLTLKRNRKFHSYDRFEVALAVIESLNIFLMYFWWRTARSVQKYSKILKTVVNFTDLSLTLVPAKLLRFRITLLAEETICSANHIVLLYESLLF